LKEILILNLLNIFLTVAKLFH